MDLSGQIGNQKFNNIFLNAAGLRCSTTKDLNKLSKNPYVGGVITKSATIKPRQGNPKPRCYGLPDGSINSMGLPNRGLQYYLNYVLQNHQKPMILSIAGISTADDLKMLKTVQQSNYKGLTELNLSCPNIAGHTQIAYDFRGTAELLECIFKFFKKPLGLKLPPYFDLDSIHQCAKILNQYPLTHVSIINSVGNGLWVNINTESPVIKPKGGFGGLGGHMILPIALANVRAFRQDLKSTIKIIGTGGIKTGADVFAHILCGAEMVAIGTQFGIEGGHVYKRLTKELKRIMLNKGYNSLADFRGELKTL